MKNRNEEWLPKWVALPILDFVRKVLSLKEEPEKLRDWAVEFASALMVGDSKSGNEMANEMIREATDRFEKKSRAGRLGGIASARARGATLPTPEGTTPTVEQLYEFARAEGLDEGDARDWYEMTVTERGGLTRNGEKIKNWKGACKRFCGARRKGREG